MLHHGSFFISFFGCFFSLTVFFVARILARLFFRDSYYTNLPAATQQTLLTLYQSCISLLGASITQLLRSVGSDDFDERAVQHKNAVKAYVFLLHWALSSSIKSSVDATNQAKITKKSKVVKAPAAAAAKKGRKGKKSDDNDDEDADIDDKKQNDDDDFGANNDDADEYGAASPNANSSTATTNDAKVSLLLLLCYCGCKK